MPHHPNPDETVAEYITRLVKLSGKTHERIREDIGISSMHFITQVSRGNTKLPIGRIPLLAKSLNCDPNTLVILALQEYQPEAWAAIQETILKPRE